MPFLKKMQDFFKEKKWKELKKTDWIALALAGVLLLIIAIPMEDEKQKEAAEVYEEGMDKAQTVELAEDATGDYVSGLEERLEEVLSQMEGVGEVKVMITLSDGGESVVEKDVTVKNSTTIDNNVTEAGDTRMDREEESVTVYVENDSGTYPYVQKELLPAIEGVFVVAEGGGNATVVSNISDAVMALFPVEVHKIKVVKMGCKEEGL